MRAVIMLMLFVIITKASCAQTTNKRVFVNEKTISILTKKVSPDYNGLNTIKEYGMCLRSKEGQFEIFISDSSIGSPLQAKITNCYFCRGGVVFFEGLLEDNSELILVIKILEEEDRNDLFSFCFLEKMQ